ncbi:MAG: hypothetical protein BWY99_00373 [Synergistetes bacterium ADurb.BinA166]|nr:MAG: hypothetical protein BWY99_00373 [Synergistetes bacterium ADurb.BinA166]
MSPVRKTIHGAWYRFWKNLQKLAPYDRAIEMRIGTRFCVEGSLYVIRYSRSGMFHIRFAGDIEIEVEGVWYESAMTRPWIDKKQLQDRLDRLSVLRVMES